MPDAHRSRRVLACDELAVMSWSPQQEAAAKAVQRWLKAPVGRGGADQVFYLAGYAGTGKTTLARSLADGVRGGAVFGAFTGKAALVLRNKGCPGARTIHSLIYRIDEEDQDSFGGSPTFVLNPFSDVKSAGVVVIDECSMVDEQLGRDLLSFGRKVLVLGDPAQLPPVGGHGFFTAREPNMMLTEVHRQAAESPIIRMSMDVREGRSLEVGRWGDCRVIPRASTQPDDVLGADQVIVGMNRTRQRWNARIRKHKGLDEAGPQVGDRLVCLKNNRTKQLLNGGLWRVESLKGSLHGKPAAPLFGELGTPCKADAKGRMHMRVTSEDEPGVKPRSISVLAGFFTGDEAEIPREAKRGTDEFTYGYALTCHKSQGSQWGSVFVLDEAGAFREDARRWRYTAITRAADVLTVAQ